MASSKERLLRARAAGTAGNMAATDTFKVRNLQPTRLGGNYTEQSYANGQEGASAEELFDQHAGVSFETDGGWGTAAGTAPLIAPLLKACGMTETVVATTSVTFAPTPRGTTFGAAELHFLNGDQAQDIGDARGALTFTANAGQRPFFAYNFMGSYTAPTAETWAVPDFSAWKDGPTAVPARMQAYTVDGIKLCVNQFSWTDGRSPAVNKFMNCDDVDNFTHRLTGRMQIEMPDLASMELVEACRTGITAPLVWEINHPTAADGAMRIAAPTVQMKWAGEADIGGIMGANIDLVFLPDQGGDDLSIIFKAQE